MPPMAFEMPTGIECRLLRSSPPNSAWPLWGRVTHLAWAPLITNAQPFAVPRATLSIRPVFDGPAERSMVGLRAFRTSAACLPFAISFRLVDECSPCAKGPIRVGIAVLQCEGVVDGFADVPKQAAVDVAVVDRARDVVVERLAHIETSGITICVTDFFQEDRLVQLFRGVAPVLDDDAEVLAFPGSRRSDRGGSSTA